MNYLKTSIVSAKKWHRFAYTSHGHQNGGNIICIRLWRQLKTKNCIRIGTTSGWTKKKRRVKPTKQGSCNSKIPDDQNSRRSPSIPTSRVKKTLDSQLSFIYNISNLWSVLCRIIICNAHLASCTLREGTGFDICIIEKIYFNSKI